MSDRQLPPELCLVVAVSRNGVIGRDGDLPWRLRTDLRRFKKLTMGHPLIMGRRTWESIGRPLPGRLSIVLSRSMEPFPEEIGAAVVVRDLEQALAIARDRGAERVFVIGGESVYRQALARAALLFLTRVEAEVEGDVFFPEVDFDAWRLVESERVPAGEGDQYETVFEVWERREASSAQAEP